ncbi:MAG: hypothetical protein P8Y26_16525 [Gemmatimonadales bacterium]
MDCKGAVALSKKLGEVRDDGVIFVLEDDCSRVFGDSMDGDEDVLMTRVEEGCGYEGTIEGTHDGVTMVIDMLWTVEAQGFIRGEMSSSTDMGPISCDFFACRRGPGGNGAAGQAAPPTSSRRIQGARYRSGLFS